MSGVRHDGTQRKDGKFRGRVDLSIARKAAALQAALKKGLLDQDLPLLMLYDLDIIAHRLAELRSSFPENTLHAIAMKANPLSGILRFQIERGFGTECASRVEVEQALRVGFSSSRIVFDSPAKTDADLRFALASGISINVDNLQEIERCARFFEMRPSSSTIGVRVNPGVGAGAIAPTGTVAPTSKFGITLDEHRERVAAAFQKYGWLRGLHVHAGSQGCSLDLIATAVAEVAHLAEEIEHLTGRPLDRINIGGGLPVCYTDDVISPTFGDLTAALRRHAPEVLSGRWKLVTEPGRSVHAQAGWVASRVEATKLAGGHRIAIIHAGADLFVRTAYAPTHWPHRVVVFDAHGTIKGGPTESWDIAGPLCFSGDLVARDAQLPSIERGDLVVVLVAGAYTLSMWSRYNSRQAPAVWAYAGPEPVLTRLKAAESVDDVLRFWGTNVR